MTRVHLALLVPLACAAGALPRAQGGGGAPLREGRVYYDRAEPDGSLTGGMARVLLPDKASLQARIDAPWRSIAPAQDSTSANRVDLVFVGDGYTAAELGLYSSHVALQAATYFLEEPFATYANYYAIHQVDVVSNESGVDHDPVFGIFKDTALDMGFWCFGIERLLCVDVFKAYAYAKSAPDVDLVVALANSTMYGGAGYPENDLATVSGGNGLATEILLHELGHALGDLADEYDYGDGTVYAGGEPPEANASTLSASAMAAQHRKWHLWLGTNDPLYDGLVLTYEGAVYSEFGVYRPTPNSLMRNLDRPFNLPSIEAIVVAIYQIVDPIDASSPVGTTYLGTETLFVDPLDPIGHALTIQWARDGVAVAGATGTTLDLGTLALEPWPHVVSATVTDPTDFVADPALRATWLTETRSFHVTPPASLSADKGSISVASGGFQDMHLDAGPGRAGDLYLLLGSLDPAPPGTPAGDVLLPLDVNAYLLFSLANPNQPPLSGSLGFLDGSGQAGARFTLPPGLLSFAGASVYHAYLAFDLATFSAGFASNALRVDLVP